MPAFAAHLSRRWAEAVPDVAHAHFWMSGLAALTAARDHGVPVVQSFHALGTVKRRWQGVADTSPLERIAVERDVGRRAAAVIATCTDEVAELRKMGVPSDRITVVPCGVDLRLFRPDGPSAPRSRRPRILSIGRMVPRKGVQTTLQALRQVPEAELVIAGGNSGDDEIAVLRESIAAYGLDGRVSLIGSVGRTEVPALMRSADVLVSVPWYEPFGIVPLEAMACGLPVVASAVGGHLDTVAGYGVLVPPRRPQALARALNDVLAQDALREMLGAAGARRARARYGWARLAADTESLYRNLIGGRLGRLAAAGG
jgi:glycosyltransferase involved in cell wall biosynthesis